MLSLGIQAQALLLYPPIAGSHTWDHGQISGYGTKNTLPLCWGLGLPCSPFSQHPCLHGGGVLPEPPPEVPAQVWTRAPGAVDGAKVCTLPLPPLLS